VHQKICCLDADANDASQETHHCVRTLSRLPFQALQTGLFDPIDLLSDYEDYTWDRPALLQWRLQKLELKAGHPSRRGGRQKGSAAAYSNKSVRDSERETIANAEDEYRRFVATWKQQSPKGRSGATNEVRRS
jgi:hypothetical protein